MIVGQHLDNLSTITSKHPHMQKKLIEHYRSERIFGTSVYWAFTLINNHDRHFILTLIASLNNIQGETWSYHLHSTNEESDKVLHWIWHDFEHLIHNNVCVQWKVSTGNSG